MTNTHTDKKRSALILLAFIAGGAVPIQLVTLSFGYAEYVRNISMGPQLFLLTLVAHVVFGVALGCLIQTSLQEEDRGHFFSFLLGSVLRNGRQRLAA